MKKKSLFLATILLYGSIKPMEIPIPVEQKIPISINVLMASRAIGNCLLLGTMVLGSAYIMFKRIQQLWQTQPKIEIENLTEEDSFANLAGSLPEDIEELKEIIQGPQKILSLGGKIPRGALLAGAPGVGKTAIARALAKESGRLFFSISAAQLGSKYIFGGVKILESIFKEVLKQCAKHKKSAIVFIDEFDAIGSRATSSHSDATTTNTTQTLTRFLEIMTNSKSEPIFWLAATNAPNVLDPALLRPGRFSAPIEIPLPTQKVRAQIFKLHINQAKFKLTPKLADPKKKNKFIKRWAQRTQNFTGADIKELLNKAAIQAGILGADHIKHVHINKQLKRMKTNKQTAHQNFLTNGRISVI